MTGTEPHPGALPNVFLVGPMGSGKSTLGRRVAQLLGLTFFDSDQLIEERTGASINLIFEIEGEAGFREREARMLEELAARRGVLIATGGGAILAAGNREVLRRNGLVVWLRTTVEQQLRRLEKDGSRPLLKAPDRRARLIEIAGIRDPLYQATADLVFNSSDRPVQVMAQALAQALLEYHAAHSGAAHSGHNNALA